MNLVLQLPSWLREATTAPLESDEERMAWVVALASRNVREGTGGPFGAAVFEAGTGALVAAGINSVLRSHCSIAHAEVVALALAQQRLERHRLDQGGLRHELVTSVEPCAMCLGAIPWSGVTRVVIGARDADARAIGFDEGSKPKEWIRSLEQRSVAVRRDVLRREAATVLEEYAAGQGELY